MEYFPIWSMVYFKTKQYTIIHKTYFPYFEIWNISEYGIFWSMEQLRLWYMEYFSIWNMPNFQNKHYSMSHKTYFPYLEYGIFWNIKYLRIWNILEYGIFWNMEYFGI